jgi:putative flippase GtrA
MKLLRQLVMFAGVGGCATLAHVLTAWSLMQFSPVEPYLANLVGACLGYGVSFLGNALLTFGVRQRLGFYAVRYLLVSLVSLVLTTIELALVTRLGLSNHAYALVVLLTVPPATFLVAKFWVFADSARTPPGDRPEHAIGAVSRDLPL